MGKQIIHIFSESIISPEAHPYLYDDLRPEGQSDEVLTKSEAIGNQCPTQLSTKKYDDLPYLYDDVRPTGALGNQSPTNLSTKKYDVLSYFYDDVRPTGALGNQSPTNLSAKKYDVLSYFYDGSILLAEKVGNQIQKIYINDGQGIIGMVRPIYDQSNNLTHYQRLYYLYDSLGSVSAITGEHGLPLTSYSYSPFGTCLNVTGDPINNLQFVGRYSGYLDNDTGLTYFWHRWYDSKDGRWISRDPIGVEGGINLYGYTNNNSANTIDPAGLDVLVPPLNPALGVYDAIVISVCIYAACKAKDKSNDDAQDVCKPIPIPPKPPCPPCNPPAGTVKLTRYCTAESHFNKVQGIDIKGPHFHTCTVNQDSNCNCHCNENQWVVPFNSGINDLLGPGF